MNRTTVKVSKRNQITLPTLARQMLNIHSRDRLLVDIQDGLIVLIPKPDHHTDTLSGLHREIWEKLVVPGYINEQRDARAVSMKA